VRKFCGDPLPDAKIHCLKNTVQKYIAIPWRVIKLVIYYYCCNASFTSITGTYVVPLLSCDALPNKVYLLWWNSRSMLLLLQNQAHTKIYVINNH